jgi:phosphate transport system substrate-binding protein
MVDFGATDAPMNSEEEAKAGAKVLHIPTALGAVVVTYNLPDSPLLKLDAPTISGIFLGTIKNWSDPAIKALNPGTILPNQEIIVVHRSDGSGTTYTFTDFLAKADKTWADKLGKGKSVNWPVGLGGKGNDGVAGLMKQNIGSIGYVEYIFAVNNNFSYALIKNKSGNFIRPTLETVSLAADVELPDDLKVSITDTDSKEGYPISTFTWLLVYQEQSYSNRTIGKGLAVANMVWWATHEAQSMNEPLNFGKLAPKVVQKAEILIKSITFIGKPILN